MKRKLICEIDEDVPTTKMALKVTGGNEWFRLLRTSKISCSLNGETKRAHIKFTNGQELLEEFNPSTECVIRRAWRKSTPLGGPSDWEVELGEPPPPPPLDQDGLRESDDQPFIRRRSTRKSLEWRIRNLPYPIETYSVAACAEEKCIVVRTTNKKFYKKIPIPELERIDLKPTQANIEYSHKFNTLIILYKKPPELVQFEKLWLQELNKVDCDDNKIDDCKTS